MTAAAFTPVILAEVSNQKESIGTLKLGLASPGPGYVKCDGSTKDVADYPEFAQGMPKIATEASLVDVTNTRPLDISTSTQVNIYANGERVFIQNAGTLSIVEQGVEIASVSLPFTADILAFEAFGNVLFARTASIVGKSSNNGLSWTWSGASYTGFPDAVVRGEFRGADYNSVTDTFVFVTALAVHKIQGTTFSTFSGHNPAGLVSFSNTTISYKDVLFDSDTNTWYVVGGVQTTSSSVSWTYFVIKSTDTATTWTIAVQERFTNGANSTRGFSDIFKKDGLFYLLDSHQSGTIGLTTKIYVTSDFSVISSSVYSRTEDGLPTDALIKHQNRIYVGRTAAQRDLYHLDITDQNHIPSWTMVSAGAAHVLAIKSDGSLWAWGNNAVGQLGDGTTTTRYFPKQIGSDTDWVYCSAGSASSAAIKSDGSLWTWGSNQSGQLGLGDLVNRNAPALVPGGKTWTKISISAGHLLGASESTSDELFSVAIDTSGYLFATGKYPLTTTGAQVSTPPTSFVSIENSRTYREVYAYCAQSTTTSISIFAIATDNTMYSWGYNASTAGFLGRGSTTTTQGIGQVGTTQSWSKIRAVSMTRVLALTTTGELWAWGLNSHGSLGLGDLVNRTSPVRIGSASNWVAMGTYSSVSGVVGPSYAVNSSGELYYFGPLAYGLDLNNSYLTYNTTNVQTSPVLEHTNFPAVDFIEIACSFSTYGSSSGYGATVLMLDGSNRLLGIGSDYMLGNATGYASITSRPEYTCFNISNNTQAIVSMPTSSTTTYVRNTSSLLYGVAYRLSATSWGRSRYRISDGTATIEASQFGPSIAFETLCPKLSGESLYRQTHGSIEYYSDAASNSGAPIILNYRTLENTLTAAYSYEPAATYATKRVFIYNTDDGINWTRVGRNPLTGLTTLVGPVYFNNKYWAGGTAGGGILYSSDLYRWNVLASPAITTTTSTIVKNSSSMVFHTNQTCYVMSSGSDSLTTVTLPIAAGTGAIAASETAWIVVGTTGAVYRAETSTLSTGTVWTQLTQLQGSTSIAYRSGVWVATNANSIFYSTNDGLTWISAQIDSSELGYVSITAGSINTGDDITGMACNNNSILVSENGIQWKRYKKPDSVTVEGFTVAVGAPNGTMLLDDNTNYRTLLLTPGPADETQFVLPKLTTAEGISYYVKAK